MIIAIFTLLVVWHGLMLGCVLQFITNDGVGIGEFAKAVVLHNVKFLNQNCDYKKARIMCFALFLLINLIGSISSTL
ncbi:MAG: hypothetical protein NC253_00895 [Ruminococcus sp.]|nr:hypothetical protein [Ruminococcus sp.]MCM1382641.1 hypothetical protein [Muribaculaceae bacterium]MCM1478976.1 hypothetical protein [Muribaculaceae bacterium]